MHADTNSMTYQSEFRNPKPEGRKNPESRNAKSIALVLRQFEFRISFGFRPSEFGFLNNMSPDLRQAPLSAAMVSSVVPARSGLARMTCIEPKAPEKTGDSKSFARASTSFPRAASWTAVFLCPSAAFRCDAVGMPLSPLVPGGERQLT